MKLRTHNQFGDPEPIVCQTRAGMARIEYFDSCGSNFYTEYRSLRDMRPPVGRVQTGPRRVAALTGVGCRGIGEATAFELAVRGRYHVVCCGREECNMNFLRTIRAAGGQITYLQADAAHADGINQLMDMIARVAGRLDLLINNADPVGDPRADSLFDLSDDGFRQVIDENLIGPFRATREALRRYMVPQKKGVVIYLGASHSRHGQGGLDQFAFGTAKCALGALVASLTAQFGNIVRFNLIRPGIMPQDVWNRHISPDSSGIGGKETGLAPSGHLTTPTDVAHAVGWLASDCARCINGIELVIDGGTSAGGIMCSGPVSTSWPYVVAPGGGRDGSETGPAKAA